MLSLFDFAEVGAAFAAFFTLLFVLVRRPHHISSGLYIVAALATLGLTTAFIVIAHNDGLSLWEQGTLNAFFSVTFAAWLLFLSAFARETPFSSPRSWSWPVWAIIAALIVSAAVGFVWQFFDIISMPGGPRVIIMTRIGKYALALIVVACAFGLLQLENTFRASTGSIRHALALPAASFALLLALTLVSASLGLLYSYIKFASVQSAAVLGIVMMIFVSRFLVFEEENRQRVVLSRQAVYSSVGILLVGGYLVLVAVAVQLLTSLGGSPRVFFSALVAFVVVISFLGILLSSSVKARVRRLVDRSLLGGKIDLPAELSSFAEDVTAAVDKNEMFSVTENVLREKCGLREVAFALRGHSRGEFKFHRSDLGEMPALVETEDWLLRSAHMTEVENLRMNAEDMDFIERQFLEKLAGRFFVPLIARQEFVGFVICASDAHIAGDVRLLVETISHQLALSLLSARQYEDLLEAKEMASFNKISSFVIHDVKNLISMVSMILQNADKKFEDPRFQRTTVDTLKSAQQRMKRMVNRLTAPTAESTFPISRCDLRKAIVDLVEEMNLSSNRKVELSVDVPELSPVRGHEERLRSILGNLIINAIEAMPQGGELRITADEEDEYVAVRVQDTGVGMDEEFVREKLFRPFQTSKSGGLGIGLYQSKEVTEQMEGKLLVASTPGKGTTFTLKLRKS
jgi:putative PEP-CTERM system histidine kinase